MHGVEAEAGIVARVELAHALDSRVGLEIYVVGDIEKSLLHFGIVKNILAEYFDLALVGSVDSGDRLEKRCFARAVVADKPVY